MAEHINIGSNGFILPEPQTILGSMLDGKPNFMALAWVTRLNYKPCIMGMGVNQGHATNREIRETGQFSINIPSVDMVQITDYVGLASGNRTDKSDVFDVHFGELENAPLIKDCRWQWNSGSSRPLTCRPTHCSLANWLPRGAKNAI